MQVLTTTIGIIALLVASGCAPSPGDDPPAADVLVAGEYRSAPSSTFALVAGTTVSLDVEGTRLSASAGCNTLGATFGLNGDVVVIDDVVSTLIGCPEDLAEQDARLSALLTSGPRATASPDGFTLTGADGATLVFVVRSVADPDRPLEATRWTLDGVLDAEAAVSAAGFETVSLVFADGTVTVTTGCGTGSAAYTRSDDSVALAPLVLNRAPGECPPGVVEAEVALAAVFGGTATASVRAGTLELRRGEVALSLRGE